MYEHVLMYKYVYVYIILKMYVFPKSLSSVVTEPSTLSGIIDYQVFVKWMIYFTSETV